MNQEKVGKFISTLRKEKGMTQQEFANKIGVTDKAVSKLENGRCLMDISLLKPISDCLDISVIELMNGERIENEIDKFKTNEFVDETLELAKSNIKSKLFSGIRVVICVLFIILLFIGYCSYKLIASEYIYKCYCDDVTLNGLSFDSVINVNSVVFSNNDYLVFDNLFLMNNEDKEYSLKIGNIFEDLDIKYFDSLNGYSGFKDNNGIYVNVDLNYVSHFINNYRSDIFVRDSKKIRNNLVVKNNIKNDIDLLKYISLNYLNDYEYSWTDSIRDMSEHFIFKHFTSQFLDDNIVSSTVIVGDYQGYILNIKDLDNFYSVIRILKDDIVYEITLYGEKYVNIKFIQELLNTLEI